MKTYDATVGVIALVFVLGIFGAAAFFKIRDKLCQKREKIIREGVQKHLANWYAHDQWKCVQVVVDKTGPFGSPIRKIVLESGHKRLVFCGGRGIFEGTQVRLRNRTEDRRGCWVGLEDEFMIPEPV